MKILMLGDFDTGGQGIRLVEAFQRHSPDDELRSMVKTTQYMAYGSDLPYRRRLAEELYPDMDVIHVRNHFGLYDPLAAKFGPKPLVIHYHGSRFRGDPHRHLREQRQRKAIGLVSTLDLWLLAPDELEWLPSPFGVEELRRAYRPEPQHGLRPGGDFSGHREGV